MNVFNVSSAAQLQVALDKAGGGDRIILAGGSYGTVNISNRYYRSAVTIESASSTNPAHFDGLHIRKSANLTLSGLDLGRGLKPGEKDWTVLNAVASSKNISMVGVKIHGSLDGNPANDGVGLIVRDSVSFSIKDSSFTELQRGTVVQGGWIIDVNNNQFSKIRSDGINVESTRNIRISGNTFKNFAPIEGDHADAIQFWNRKDSHGSSGITIRDNVMMQSTKGTVQGIFMSDANGHRYSNVGIINNLFYSNDAYHGIHVTEADKISVIGNTVVSQKGDAEKLWIYLTKNTGLLVKDNIADHVRVENNVKPIVGNNASILSNPALANLFGDLNTPDGIAALIAKGFGYSRPGTSRPLASAGIKAVALGLDYSNSAHADIIPVPVQPAPAPAPVSPLPLLFPDLEPTISTPAFAAAMHRAVGQEWFALP
jgi:hypothetical protein